MKRPLLAIIFLVLAACSCWAEGPVLVDPEQAFKSANERYAAGDYEGAIRDYRSILDTGLKSGNLYYNTANALMKGGKLGEAILYYERARLLMPRDGDILSNHKYAKSRMKQKDLAKNRYWLLASIEVAFEYFTYHELLWLSLSLYYLIALFLIVCIFFRNARGYLVPVIVIVVVLLLIDIPPLIQKSMDLRRAGIVTVTLADARFEPLKKGEVNFPVYEGMRVSILTTKNNWRKIQRPDGKIGWVPADSVQPITPQNE